jgi:hypothetical protein
MLQNKSDGRYLRTSNEMNVLAYGRGSNIRIEKIM